jgi:hypothetical protein
MNDLRKAWEEYKELAEIDRRQAKKTIARLARENERLKAELLIARSYGQDAESRDNRHR